MENGGESPGVISLSAFLAFWKKNWFWEEIESLFPARSRLDERMGLAQLV